MHGRKESGQQGQGRLGGVRHGLEVLGSIGVAGSGKAWRKERRNGRTGAHRLGGITEARLRLATAAWASRG